ncbi:MULTISPECIES: spore coat protein [unclassified Paenibacillus]|uniref:spore coat protein n=1 Tax=unclassified Paenibacillus TaxID=185978 RepID=UPI001B79D9B2|nr:MULTISPECIES: spore coat protein [unclassified Paenibacillus]MBP1153812.1 spore coat protein CotF [Paenibacillus sp. PvP091]MBP1170803.1 spore coat protein CotF [Paenibacillus sp. PvR098]MBP2441831.1 spore coat protein CotF [Paenibacillus sp. PvP052]
MEQRFAAHEFLETQEAVRTKAAHLELYGVLFSMAQDTHLKDILFNQQRRMLDGYNFGVQLLQGRGMNMMPPHTPELRIYERPQTGLQQPAIPAPNPNASQLSDFSIATIALNMHKTGSAISMLWACECVDPQIRQYHATSSNICQEMAWEMFQYMNYKGYYQAPQLADHTMRTMIEAVQPSQQQQQVYQTHFNH